MSTHEKKPRPTMAALQWIEKHTGNAEAAVHDYQAFEDANVLGVRLLHAAWLTEVVAGNLARNAIGRRESVEILQSIHQMIYGLGRDLARDFPSQADERDRWNQTSNGIAPWLPPTAYDENTTHYG